MITGINAKIKFGNKFAAYITNWSVEMQTSLAEIITLGSKDKACLPMEQSWSASADGLIIKAATVMNDEVTPSALIASLTQAFDTGSVVDVYFELDTQILTGKALIESLSFEASAGEIPKVSISISGANTLELKPRVVV